ncbi:MAG: tRNA (N6-isopentenyl adenosine(37)-C2)-methylthiotransferase MiaB [Anaerolineae bacterium]
MMPKHYYLWNIGCQMNRSDAARAAEALEARGYRPVALPEQADILLLNTCVVRQSAEDKVLGRLNSLKPLKYTERPRALLVMGCFVGDSDALAATYPFVDAFFAPSDVPGILAFVDAWDAERAMDCTPADQTSPSEVADMVPISYGCDHHCTYCIVTIRRGPERSRPISEIVTDVERLVRRGTREVTLLGQNVDSYGHDLPGQPDLADILAAIHPIEDLWRIRFLTSHPREMSDRIIEAVATLPKVCESWELPVQSGDDQVLRRMARGYTADHYRALVGRIRQAVPDCGINTDIIVGFPGESEAQFANTLALVEELRFSAVHVAPYSVRPGTPAARMEDDVPAEEKERRRALIDQVQTRIATEANAAQMGQDLEVLVDGRQKGRWRGRTRANKLVFFASPEEWLGRLAQVHITWTGPWSMIGEVRKPC